MKTIARTLLICLIVLNAACSTFKPMAASAEQIQRLIRTERLLSPGDRVRFVTGDTLEHDFRIAAIDLDEDLVIGATDVVPIRDIVEIETRQLSWVKTGLLLGVLTLALIDTDCTDGCGYGPYPYYVAYHCCP